MQIAIIGAGQVGLALAKTFRRNEISFVLGVKDVAQPLPAWEDGKAPPPVLQAEEAAKDASIILLCVPWGVALAALEGLGSLDGKIVIDCTNPLRMGPAGLELVPEEGLSGAEQLAAAFPSAHFVKTFNQTGFEVMADPGQFSQKPTMFVAADDTKARQTVLKLVDKCGFDARDAGGLQAARWLEGLAMTWIHYAINMKQGREQAFVLVKRKGA